MKKMGMDPADFNMGGSVDPEMAELEKMMRKQGKSTSQVARKIV